VSFAIADVDVVWTTLLAPQQLIEELAKEFTVLRRKYDRKKGKSIVIAKVPFVDVDSGSFLTGLLPRIAASLRRRGVELQINSHYPVPDYLERDYHDLLGFEDREYVSPAIEALAIAHRGGWNMATNAGKTYIGAAAIYQFGLLTLYVEPMARADLVPQTVRVFRRLGIKNVGWVKASRLPTLQVDTDTEDSDKQSRIVIASGATLVARLRSSPIELRKWLNHFQMLVVDEGHEISDELFKLLLEVNAPIRLIMSGTLETGQTERDLRRVGLSGETVSIIDNDYLINKGYSARPYIFSLKVKHPNWDKKYRRGHSFNSVYNNEIVNNKTRNDLIVTIVNRLLELGEQVVLLLKSIKQIRAMATRIRELGWRVSMHTGKQGFKKRAELRDAFESGDKDCLVANVTFDTGISVNGISAVVSAGGGRGDKEDKKTGVKERQRLGRGLRAGDGKERVLWIDFADDCLYLKGQAASRRRVYESYSSFVLIDVKDFTEIEDYMRAQNLLLKKRSNLNE
jgi:superfamily II DNA or RNA helicase